MTDNTDTFDQALIKIIPRLRRYARVLAITADGSDELLQATLERALAKKLQWQQDTYLDRWLFTIMSSIWKNELRYRNTRKGNGVIHDINHLCDNSKENKPERTFLLTQVFKEVMLLSENHREAILLVYIEGIKYQHAADILSIPLGTLMSRLARARIILAEKFSETNETNNNAVIKLDEHRGNNP